MPSLIDKKIDPIHGLVSIFEHIRHLYLRYLGLHRRYLEEKKN